MPKKPDKATIEASKKSLDPKAVLSAVINETPELRDALVAAGLVEEIKENNQDG